MFTETSRYYDKFYTWKNYAVEARSLRSIIERYKRAPGRRLLDVACGTGKHLPYLAEDFEVEGTDLSPEFLAMARERCPDVTFHEADMAALDLGRTYDVILCLFSSIGYVKTVERLRATIAGFARHLNAGGVAIVEPWFSREQYRHGNVHMNTVNEADLKLCRMNVSEVDGDLSVLDFHYLIGTPDGVRHCTERHELAMFSVEDFAEAAARTELGHEFLPALTDRGLHVFRKA